MRLRLVVALAAGALSSLGPAAPAPADSAPDAGVAFEPAPQSREQFASRPPSDDPERQRHVVEAGDGADLYVETWLPAPKAGASPPARVPTILIATPYVKQGVEEYPAGTGRPSFVEYMNARGYAVAQHHIRGTGESGGCLEQTATHQIDDVSRVIEYLGRDASWSDGNVGMYGISYDAETQISTAGLAQRDRLAYLRAIIPAASVGGQYEYSFFDGVPYAGQALLSNTFYLAGVSIVPGDTSTPEQYLQKLSCQSEVMTSSADQSGDMTPFWKVREYRPGAPNVTVPTLYVHGLADWNVKPITIAGWFDRLPAGTPHKGLFGVWNHAFPDRHAGVQPDWARDDWLGMVTAWFDQYLKGLPAGVDRWPDVQVQDSSGQWRADPEFPTTGGPAGHLPLVPGEGGTGVLGGTEQPTGSTTFIEARPEVPGGQAVFSTQPLRAPLHITGQPMLDLWLRTDKPDAHLAARLQVIDANGEVQVHDGSFAQELATYGYRSLRHLDPMPDNYFVQEEGKPAPTGEPIHLALRFHPNDLLVPAGGQLRLTISGGLDSGHETLPSGAVATIELLHDCTYPSALRFVMPHESAPLINVRETDEKDAALASNPGVAGSRDGAGLATLPLCGRPPERAQTLGPPRPAAAWPPPPPPPSTAPPPCLDDLAPQARLARRASRARRRTLTIRGTASDAGCGAAARVARVELSVARIVRGRCRYVRRSRRLSRPRSCARTSGTFLRARGTDRWRLVLRRLPRGVYRIRVRAVDSAGNVQRLSRGVRIRVR